MRDEHPASITAATAQPQTGERKRAPRRLDRALLFNGLAFLILLGGYGVALFQVVQAEAGVGRQAITIAGPVPVTALHFTPAVRQGNAIAILVHGYDGDKENMTSLGLALAHAGIPSYLMDQPGFGQSTVAAPLDAGYSNAAGERETALGVRALGETVDYARAHAGVSDPHIVLAGHSYGTNIVAQYALSQPPAAIAATILISPDFAVLNYFATPGAIFISPDFQYTPTLSHPANLLVLYGQNDIGFVIPVASKVITAACGGSLPTSGVCGDVSQGTGRQLIRIPGATHGSIISDPVALRAVNVWVAATDRLPAPNPASAAINLFPWLYLGVACAGLALFPLLVLLTALLRLREPRPVPASATPASHADAGVAAPAKGRAWLRVLGQATLATVGAVGVLELWWYVTYTYLPSLPALTSPLAWIGLYMGDMAGSLLLASAVALALAARLARRPVWPHARRWLRQVTLGVVAAAFLYFTVSAITGLTTYNLWLSPLRLWRAGVLLVAGLLFFAVVERMMESAWPKGNWCPLLARWWLALVVSVELLLLYFFEGGQAQGLGLTIPAMMLALIAVSIVAIAWLRALGRDTALAGAILAAFVFAWIPAALLLMTA